MKLSVVSMMPVCAAALFMMPAVGWSSPPQGGDSRTMSQFERTGGVRSTVRSDASGQTASRLRPIGRTRASTQRPSGARAATQRGTSTRSQSIEQVGGRGSYRLDGRRGSVYVRASLLSRATRGLVGRTTITTRRSDGQEVDRIRVATRAQVDGSRLADLYAKYQANALNGSARQTRLTPGQIDRIGRAVAKAVPARRIAVRSMLRAAVPDMRSAASAGATMGGAVTFVSVFAAPMLAYGDPGKALALVAGATASIPALALAASGTEAAFSAVDGLLSTSSMRQNAKALTLASVKSGQPIQVREISNEVAKRLAAGGRETPSPQP